MAETYEIKYGDASAGTAQMEKQGLYCSFSCRCRLPDDGLYRIHVISGDSREDLGICVPMDGAFGMDKRIPAKRLGEGEMRFELVSKDWKPQAAVTPQPAEPAVEEEISTPEPVEETFVPVSEEEPFEHLDKLENAMLAEQDGQIGIIIQETPE